jgi:1-acyl-sn-glycerol-3-phosphate acyltransferase
VPRRKLGFWLRLAVMILKPPMTLLTKRDWRGRQYMPAHGGVVVVVNHISYVDPVAFAHFVYDSGRNPRFLAKDSLFKVFFVGQVLRGSGQIPVYRLSRDASASFRDAVAAVRRGECVCVYAEGTVTRDPGLWPMTGKTGAARIALTAGVPVIPVAQWGAQELLPPYAKRFRLFPRKTMHLVAGPPVDLSEFEGKELTAELLRAATTKIMDAVTALLEELRGEQAPAERFDMRKHKVPETGNPARQRGAGEGTGPERESA